MKNLQLKISIDDYHPRNLELADIFRFYGLEKNVIFFIECTEKEKIKQIYELAKQGFEIGSHTINHPMDLKRLDNDELEYEILKSRETLQIVTQQEINWFCYPRGRYSQLVIDWVKKAGYQYARTTKIGMPDYRNPYELETTVHFFPRKEYNGKDWLEVAKNAIGQKNLHFWGHAKEIIQQNDWNKLKILCDYLLPMIQSKA